MSKQYFKESDDLNHEKLNKVFQDNYRYTDNSIEESKGSFNKKETVIGANNVPEDLSDGKFTVEFNDTNKRLLFNIKGKLFKAD